MRKNTLLCRVLIGGALAFASVAHGMPSESDIKRAKPVVESLIADDMYALNKKMKPPATVAAAMRTLAEKSESEAGKFLLLQSIFSVYASNGMYDEAGDALENLNSEISDMSPDEIVKMVDGAMNRVGPEKAPKVLSIYRAAQRKVKCRRRLESAKVEFKKNPNDKALIRTIGDCHAGLGDWPKALKAYARLGIAAAKYELSPATTINCDAMAAADFWWDYKAADDEPFKVHAAELYGAAVEKGLATGLRREMALKRIEDSKQLDALRAQARQASQSHTRQTISDSTNVGKAEKTPKQGDTKTLILPGGAPMEMIYVAPGSFTMGSPTNEEGRGSDETQHRVTLTKGYWLGKYEVTQKQWQSVMGNNPSNWKGASMPVENVSWDDCIVFVRNVNAQLNCGARLPTEAEWEYACRAGTSGVYGGRGRLDGMGWYSNNSNNKTHEVGGKSPNAWGFYDMHGNVREWCNDWYGSYSGNATDPTGPASGGRRVLRGGCWINYARDCSSASRDSNHPYYRMSHYGFRLCCSAGPHE